MWLLLALSSMFPATFGSLPLPLGLLHFDEVGIPAPSSFVPGLSTTVSINVDRTNLWERAQNAFFTTWLSSETATLLRNQQQAFYDEFGSDFPSLQQLFRNVSFLFVNSNPLFEIARPSSAKIVNVAGIGGHLAGNLTEVHSGDATSGPHVFHVNFMPVNVRVFIQESLLLNNSEQSGIGRRNLLASAYPQNFPPEELIYHVVEPPKFGMLSRRVEGGKQRRIGVSSNFSQQHVDEGLLTYKLHFVHYSVVSDFFVFRLVTPAAVSELLRFDITYIPGGNSLHLLNRTLVVNEGGTQQITNNSLWLETADDTNFVFTIAVPPFNGRFVLVNDVGAKFIPGLGGTFTSFDILSKRLFYEHSGDESRSDRAYLIAESIYRQNTRIPLWFSITIIAENDHAPEPCFRHQLDRVHSEIHLVDGGERVFHSSLLCWRDQGADNGHSSLSYYFPVLSKDFMISARELLELLIGNFTQKDLDSRRLVISQLSMKREMTLRYAVSDGKYVANGSVTLIASDPFLRLSQRQLELPHGLEPGLIPVSVRSLAAGTNLDVDPSEIRFELHPGSNSPFRLLSNDGLIKPTSSLYQRDIERHRVFLLVGDSSLTTVPLSVKVADKVSEGALTVTYSDKSGLSFHVDPELRLAPSSVLDLDSSVLRAKGSEAADVKFLLIDQPKHGSIVLQMPEDKLKSARPSNNFIMGFRQSDLDAGLLQYLHAGTPVIVFFSLGTMANTNRIPPTIIAAYLVATLSAVDAVLPSLESLEMCQDHFRRCELNLLDCDKDAEHAKEVQQLKDELFRLHLKHECSGGITGNAAVDSTLVGCAAVAGSIVTFVFMAVFYRRDRVEKKVKTEQVTRTADGGYFRTESVDTNSATSSSFHAGAGWGRSNYQPLNGSYV